MMRIFQLMGGGDPEIAELLHLKRKIRSAVRAMGGSQVEVKWRRKWHVIKVYTGGGVRVLLKSDGQEITDRDQLLTLFRKLTEEVTTEPKRKVKRTRRSSKFEMD